MTSEFEKPEWALRALRILLSALTPSQLEAISVFLRELAGADTLPKTMRESLLTAAQDPLAQLEQTPSVSLMFCMFAAARRELTPAQVRAVVDELHREAEVAGDASLQSYLLQTAAHFDT